MNKEQEAEAALPPGVARGRSLNTPSEALQERAGGVGPGATDLSNFVLRVYDAKTGKFQWEGNLNLTPVESGNVGQLVSTVSPRRATDAAPATEPSVTSAPEASYATKALQKFLTSLQGVENPLLLDLGPVVGSNVPFFGEHLGCHLLVDGLLHGYFLFGPGHLPAPQRGCDQNGSQGQSQHPPPSIRSHEAAHKIKSHQPLCWKP